MNQNFLTDSQCYDLEDLANELNYQKGMLEEHIATLKYAIKNEDISAWIQDTEAGQEIYAKVTKYNENLSKLANNLLDVKTLCDFLIYNSRQNNKAS